jgi:hypothetical protein
MAGDHRQEGPAVVLRGADSDAVFSSPVALHCAAAIGVLILVAALTVAGFVAVNFFRRSSTCRVQIESLRSSLNLTNLALVPSGRVLRHPDTAHRGIDLRYCPALPPIQTDPAALIIKSEKDVAR